MQFYDSTHPKGTRGTCQRPGGWKSKSRIWVFFVEGTPAIELLFWLCCIKQTCWLPLVINLVFFANFWFDAAPRPCGLHDALSVMQCGDMWCYARWIYTRWSVVEMEILTLVWCHWRNRDTWFLGDDISMTQRFQKSLYLVSLFLQWWNAVQLNKKNSEVHAKLPWALMPWVWCSMVF